MAPCKFNKSWLDQTDANGRSVKTWAKTQDDKNIYCIVCEKKICIQRGICAINQHALGKKHQEMYKIKLSDNQLRVNLNNNNLIAFNSRTQAATAEILLTLRIISRKQSFESSRDLKDVLTRLFPGTDWLDNFSLSPSKMTYLINYALGPYFDKKIIDDVGGMYTIMYDETTNKSSHKELQIQIRFWSVQKNEVVAVHLQSFFLDHARAEDIVGKINVALDKANLSKSKLLMLGSDGPNINKKVFRLINDDVKSLRSVGLINIGTCNIHIIHNAFSKGLQVFGYRVGDLLIAIKYFFKDKPSRWSDYEDIQKKLKVPQNHFLKHVASRWLTIEPAAIRLLEQWPAVTDNFLKYIPTKCANIEKTSMYKTIKEILLKPFIKAEIKFVITSAKLFASFTEKFQSSKPLIHLLFDEIKLLVTKIILRICKKDCVKLINGNNKSNVSSSELFKTENLIATKHYNKFLEPDVVEDLKKLGEPEILVFAHNVKKHYVEACTHILKKVPLLNNHDNQLLKALSCLCPNNIKNCSGNDILVIAKTLPNFDFNNNSALLDEWKLLQIDDLFLYKENNSDDRVDYFWRNVFNKNADKYPILSLVVKSILNLSHGNADVERGFSTSARVLTKDRSRLSERTLSSLLTISDYISTYTNGIEQMPIDSELLALARGAHSAYIAEQEQKKQENKRNQIEQQQKELEKEKLEQELRQKQTEQKHIKEMEKELSTLKEAEQGKSKAADILLKEANKKLSMAIKNNNLIEANVAQSLIEAAQKKKEEAEEYKTSSAAVQKQVNKRKADLLSYFSKKPRTA